MVGKHPMGRLGWPRSRFRRRVSGFGCASFITGQEIAVDGGRSIR